MRQLIFTYRIPRVLILLLFIAGACSSSSTGPEGPDDRNGPGIINEGGITAELAAETVMVEDHVIESGLINSDEETHTYTFDADVVNDADLELVNGGILLLEKRALRRITSVTESNGQLTVRTSDDVTLEEAFKELDIDVSESLEFSPDVVEKAVMEFQGKQFRPNKSEDGTASWEYQVGAYKVTGSVQALGNRAVVNLVMHKDYGSGGVAFSTEATIQKLTSDLDVQIRDHKTRSFNFQNPGMEGKVDLALAAAGGGTDPSFGFGPLTMFQFMFTVGPVPVRVVAKVQTVASITVHSRASATAKTSVSYSGAAGVSFDGTKYSTTVGGGLEIPLFGSSEGDSAPSGFDGYNVDTQYGFAAPVIEVQLFGNIVVPFIRPEFYIGSRFHWAPICKNVYVRYGVKGGIDLRFLGKNLASSDELEIVKEVRQDGYSNVENCSQHFDMSKSVAGDENRFPGEIWFGNEDNVNTVPYAMNEAEYNPDYRYIRTN